MRTPIIKTIAKKELREALRDRRTLFMMVFLPVLLYPALLVLVTQVSAVQMTELEETPSHVGVTGAPADHPLFEALEEEPLIEASVVDSTRLQNVDMVIDASGWPVEFDPQKQARVTLHFASVDDNSRQALDRVEEVLAAIDRDELIRRLAEADLPPDFADPLRLEPRNLSSQGQQGGFVLAAVLPILVLITVLMGAYYPAIDLTAGEKERGTIQTLFTAPISALEIVAGKYVAVVGIAALSGGANLLSMALVMGQNLVLTPELREHVDLSISFPVFLVLAFNIVLIALLFSALLLAVAVLARSFKEAQTYVTPVFLLCLIPATIAQLPGVEYSPQTAVLPAVGAIVLMKQLLLHGVQIDALVLVATSSLVWTSLALVVAARLFGKESVIVGEQGALNVIPRRADIKPRARPGVSDVFAWYAVLFVLLFYVGATIQAKFAQPGLLITLWVVLLLPTYGIARWGKLNIKETFALRAPTVAQVAAATLLALSALVLVNWLNGLIDTHLLPMPDAMAEEMMRFFPPPEGAVDWFILLFLVAFSPAVCEELVFRGFITSGLRGRMADWKVILIVGLLFGAFHLSVYRLFGTAILGMLMTFVALRSRSIVPAMVFHFLNNGLAMIVTYGLPGEPVESFPMGMVAFALPLFGLSIYLVDRTRAPARG